MKHIAALALLFLAVAGAVVKKDHEAFEQGFEDLDENEVR